MQDGKLGKIAEIREPGATRLIAADFTIGIHFCFALKM